MQTMEILKLNERSKCIKINPLETRKRVFVQTTLKMLFCTFRRKYKTQNARYSTSNVQFYVINHACQINTLVCSLINCNLKHVIPG